MNVRKVDSSIILGFSLGLMDLGDDYFLFYQYIFIYIVLKSVACGIREKFVAAVAREQRLCE